MPDQQSAEKSLLVSREQRENAFWHGLRMFVGRGKRHSAAEVSEGSGVHRRTLDCYRGYTIGHPDWRPLSEDEKWSLASYIGADLTSKWLAPLGQAAFNLPDGPADHDAVELAARDFLATKGQAHSETSPAGRDISGCEDTALTEKRAVLKAVA